MIILNGSKMKDRGTLHAELKRGFDLPDYYGNNLDALNDCLSERSDWEPVVLENAWEFMENCGLYADKVIRVLVMNGIAITLR